MDPADLDRAVAALAPLGAEPTPGRRAHPVRSPSPPSRARSRLLDAVRTLDSLGIEVADIGLRRPTLDEVFLALTGRPAEAEPDPGAEGTDDDQGRRRRGRAA